MADPFDLTRVKVHPLLERKNLTHVDSLLVDPDSEPSPLDEAVARLADDIAKARANNKTVLLIYGAHLLRNGAALLVDRMLERNWLTHLATNGAGSIHDWECAWLGATSEDVRANVSTGTFGTWDETSRYIHLALMVGSLQGLGYGASLGKFIEEDGCPLPSPQSLTESICSSPQHPLTAARADLLQTLTRFDLPLGKLHLEHRWKHASIFASAHRHGIPLTVHPGIGYDIIANHPIFNGAVLGRAAQIDFELFGRALDNLDGGVVLNVGSAIMGPQVFEKSLSCVNNVRLQEGRPIVTGFRIAVVDLQDGGNWDWTQGEPPKDNPAYYLRYCKTFARMGGDLQYHRAHNVSFLHHLSLALEAQS